MKYDKKQNGKVAVEKLRLILQDAALQISEESLLAGIDSLDINSDGRFIYEEMRKWWFSGHRVRSG